MGIGVWISQLSRSWMEYLKGTCSAQSPRLPQQNEALVPTLVACLVTPHSWLPSLPCHTSL